MPVWIMGNNLATYIYCGIVALAMLFFTVLTVLDHRRDRTKK